MDELVYMLVNNSNDSSKCEQLLEDYRAHPRKYVDNVAAGTPVLLDYFLTSVSNKTFRRLFHVNKETIPRISKEIQATKTFQMSSLNSCREDSIVDFLCVVILYLNSCFSTRCCALFCGITNEMVEAYVNTFNKIMNEMKDKIIRFPALNCQNLLKVNSKRFFPGAVGVVDSVFIPKLFSVDENGYSFSEEHRKQGIKLLLVVGRDGNFFNLHISENGKQSNCSIYNESALGYTLRYHKRSVLNRGSFLIADRSYPELPYLQVPFSMKEIIQSGKSTSLSNYNYWHHKARFVAEKSIKRWLYRSPKCKFGLPYLSPRNCIIFVISSLVLHQMCQILDDVWTDDDDKIRCVAVVSTDAKEFPNVDQECYKIYDSATANGTAGPGSDYYGISSMEVVRRDSNGEVVDESILNSTYEKLKIIARKRRDFLVDLIYLFPNRTALFYDD